MRVTLVAERGAARALVRAKQTDAALVVPAGTSAALAVGQPSQLILYIDPVKVIELDVIRDLVQEIRHELEVAAPGRGGGRARSDAEPPISVANSTTPRGRARALHEPDAPASRAESCGPGRARFVSGPAFAF